MYLKYWYEDELNSFSKLDEKGSDWIYLTSREFERIFGYKEKFVNITRCNSECDSESHRIKQQFVLNQLEEIWKNLKKFKRIRDVVIPYRIVCNKEKLKFDICK